MKCSSFQVKAWEYVSERGNQRHRGWLSSGQQCGTQCARLYTLVSYRKCFERVPESECGQAAVCTPLHAGQ